MLNSYFIASASSISRQVVVTLHVLSVKKIILNTFLSYCIFNTVRILVTLGPLAHPNHKRCLLRILLHMILQERWCIDNLQNFDLLFLNICTGSSVALRIWGALLEQFHGLSGVIALFKASHLHHLCSPIKLHSLFRLQASSTHILSFNSYTWTP